jgi:hypothetical protein
VADVRRLGRLDDRLALPCLGPGATGLEGRAHGKHRVDPVGGGAQ